MFLHRSVSGGISSRARLSLVFEITLTIKLDFHASATAKHVVSPKLQGIAISGLLELHFAIMSLFRQAFETGPILIGRFGAIRLKSSSSVSSSLSFGHVSLLNSPPLLLKCCLLMTNAIGPKSKIIKHKTLLILEFDRSEEN